MGGIDPTRATLGTQSYSSYQLGGTQLSGPTPIPYPNSTGGVGGFSATDQLVDLRGANVTLRPLTPADYTDYRTVVERNLERLRPAALAPAEGPMPIDSEEAFENAWRASEEARQFGTDYHFGIFEGDQFIGEIVLAGVRRDGLDTAFLEAWIDSNHAGQNRVEEAFILICKYGIEELGLNRIESAVLPENEAVQRAFGKVGVENEGLAREFVKINGEYKDHYRFVVTGTDWKNRRDEWMSQWVGS